MKRLKELPQEQRESGFRARYDEHGREIPDTTKVEVPVKFQVPETTEEKMRRILKVEAFKDRWANAPEETEDELNDFYIDDDPEPYTPHEFIVMAEDYLKRAGHKVERKPADQEQEASPPPAQKTEEVKPPEPPKPAA